jgi:hypothetical protein
MPAAYAIPIGLSLALGFCLVAMSIVMLSDVSGHHATRADVSPVQS